MGKVDSRVRKPAAAGSPRSVSRRPDSHAGTIERARVLPVAMVTVLASARCAARRASRVSSSVRSAPCAASRNWRPSAVRRTGNTLRSISGAPAHTSTACMRRPNAGGVTLRSSAARARLPACARQMKSSSQRICMEGGRVGLVCPHYRQNQGGFCYPCATRRRQPCGVSPVQRLNACVNALCSEYPSRIAHCARLTAGSARYCSASARRTLSTSCE
ncbi:hypothetical protein D9M70_465440 [compost metagenome]